MESRSLYKNANQPSILPDKFVTTKVLNCQGKSAYRISVIFDSVLEIDESSDGPVIPLLTRFSELYCLARCSP